jgi:hypothetical protein
METIKVRGDQHDIGSGAQAIKSCAQCGGTAYYWRTAIIAGNPAAPPTSGAAKAHQQPAWSCLSCGLFEPHERRVFHDPDYREERRHL